MRLPRILIAMALLAILLIGVPPSAQAHEPHECPAGYPDGPAIQSHLAQSDIVSGSVSFGQIFEAGRELFAAVFNVCDGQGRPASTGTGEKREPGQPAITRVSAPDSNACAGCHNQPRAGGGGDFVANVFVLAQAMHPVGESISSEFSNERNTLGMFGAGPIEMLAREITFDLHAIRDQAIADAQASGEAVTRPLVAKGVDFGWITALPDGALDTSGVEGVDPDLVIKPFHQSGVVVSIREFTVNAMNHHHGMQAEERFDLNPSKGADYDEDGVANELTLGDITAATIYQAALGTPGQLLPRDRAGRAAIEQGEQLFAEAGCAGCHVPAMVLESRDYVEPNPFNPPGTFSDTSQPFSFDMTKTGEGPYLERGANGTAIVRAYTDLKRHDLCDNAEDPDPIRFFCNERLAQNRPDQKGLPGSEFFITRKLWDAGSSAPYGHRGDLTTLTEAILAHGGEGRESRDAFANLAVEEQAAIISFLKSLQVLPPESEPAASTSVGADVSRVSMGGLVIIGLASVVFIAWRRRFGWVEND